MTDAVPSPLIPSAFAADLVSVAGAEGEAWIERLPELVASSCARWSLTIDGSSMHGIAGLVVPVRTRDDIPAVLKVSWPHPEAEPEPLALRTWAGRGAVRLLAEHADSWTMLLERLDSSRSLEALPASDEADDPGTAVTIAAELLACLHIPAPTGVPTVRALAARWTVELPEEWERCGRPLPRSLLDEAVATCRELGPDQPDRLLHGDFHYANILAGGRKPWLVIDPKPLAGDPAFDAAPLLRNRWSDVTATGDVRRAVRRRLDAIVDVAGLDPQRARAWVVARSVDNVLWATEKDAPEFAEIERTIAESLSA